MPTGYTAAVQDGTITTLRDFAMQCARGMGALIMMRDEPHGAPIPERFEPSPWNADRLAEAKSEMAALIALSDEEATAKAREAFEAKLARFNERKAERALQLARYQTMLAQVEAWTTEAEGLREFMLEQLRSSIDFDCRPISDDDPFIGRPVELAGPEWRAAEATRLAKDIAYHTKAHAEEVERVERRNAWLGALRASLGDTPSEQGRAA